MNIIKCTHCGKDIEISEALTQQIQGEITKNLEDEYKQKLAAEREKALAEQTKKLTEQFQLQIQQAKEEATEADKRNKELMEQMTEITREMRQLRTKNEETKLEMEKKLAEEEEKIRQDAIKKAQEDQNILMMQKDKQLKTALEEVEEMKRKLQQGSQQLQGEAFENEFEDQLTLRYPNDKVIPVGKGMRGGDIIQEVWDRNGNMAGKILWELKNTKTWQEVWIEKLKGDQRMINADEAVLISVVLPGDMKTAGFRSNVWVTQPDFVFALADTLRAKLIQMYYVKSSMKGKDTKMEVLYGYLSGTEFKHRVEAIIEAFTNMQQEIEKEKRYFANKWSRDEKNIRQVIDNTIGMHGDLKGIMGATIPQIRGLDIDSLELSDGKTS